MSSRGGQLLAVVAALACAVGIYLVQPGLARTTHKLRLGDDVSALPPPRELRALSLGYHAAGADLLWASLVVEQGVRTAEKRPFGDVTRYIDGVIALDPSHALLYHFVDSLIVYKPVGVASEADIRVTRTYLERGLRERPYDHALWLHYGQFLAFLAPGFMKDEQEIEQWRRDGAFAMARAVDLGSDAGRTLTVSALLGKAGETKAQIEHLQRAFALSDDADTRHQIAMKLASLNASVEASGAVEAVETEWHERFPFMSRGSTLLLGPRRDSAACAGLASTNDPRCPGDWTSASRR